MESQTEGIRRTNLTDPKMTNVQEILFLSIVENCLRNFSTKLARTDCSIESNVFDESEIVKIHLEAFGRDKTEQFRLCLFEKIKPPVFRRKKKPLHVWVRVNRQIVDLSFLQKLANSNQKVQRNFSAKK